MPPEEIVVTLRQVEVNSVWPHASLGYRPLAPEAFIPALTAWRKDPA